jgi:hypothetical protein
MFRLLPRLVDGRGRPEYALFYGQQGASESFLFDVFPVMRCDSGINSDHWSLDCALWSGPTTLTTVAVCVQVAGGHRLPPSTSQLAPGLSGVRAGQVQGPGGLTQVRRPAGPGSSPHTPPPLPPLLGCTLTAGGGRSTQTGPLWPPQGRLAAARRGLGHCGRPRPARPGRLCVAPQASRRQLLAAPGSPQGHSRVRLLPPPLPPLSTARRRSPHRPAAGTAAASLARRRRAWPAGLGTWPTRWHGPITMLSWRGTSTCC